LAVRVTCVFQHADRQQRLSAGTMSVYRAASRATATITVAMEAMKMYFVVCITE